MFMLTTSTQDSTGVLASAITQEKGKRKKKRVDKKGKNKTVLICRHNHLHKISPKKNFYKNSNE